MPCEKPPETLSHIGKSLHCLGKAVDGLIGVAMLNAVPDTMADMSLQDHLAAAVECGFGRIDLRQNILTGDILIHHTVDRLHLPDDFPQPAVQVFGVHALLHSDKPPGGSFFRRVRAFI